MREFLEFLGAGETFGHISVLSGLPPPLQVRAAEDTLCYRLPDPRTILAHPDRLRFAHYGSLVARERLISSVGAFARLERPIGEVAHPITWCDAAVPIRGGRVKTAESVYGLVHVPGDVPESSTRFHNLRTQDLDGAPPLADCVATLDELTRGHPVVAHCAWVERSFLRKAFRRSQLSFGNAIVDTAALAHQVLDLDIDPDQVVALEYAATALGLPVHSPHHALGDAVTTATLFIALAGRLEHGTTLTTAALLQMSEGR